LRLACIASISIGFYPGLKHFSLFGGGPKNGRRGGEEMLGLFPVKAKNVLLSPINAYGNACYAG